MGKRVLAVCMAVVVAFGCSLYRPKKIYANELVLAGEALDVLFGLLGATGVVVGFEETFEKRQEDTLQFFEDLPQTTQDAYWDWYNAGQLVTSDTGHTVFYPNMEVDTSWYRNLWNGVKNQLDSYIAYDFAVDGYLSYDLPSSQTTLVYDAIGGFDDNTFMGFTRADSGCIFGFVNENTIFKYSYSNEIGNTYNFIEYFDCSSDCVMNFGIKYLTSTKCQMYVGFVNNPVTTSYLSYNVVLYNYTVDTSSVGVAWGSDSYGKFVCGYPDLYSLNFDIGGSYFDEYLIPCDTWVSKWDDAKAEARQVGIVTGQDLSGYNTLDDIYNPETGLVTGLDVPVVDVPDVPADDILSRLKALPSDIANALRDLLASLFIPTTTALDDFVFEARGKLPVIDNFFSIDLNNYVTDDGKPRWFFVYKGVEYDIFDMSIFDRYRTMLHMIIIAIAYYRFYRWVLKIMPSVIKGR